ncbi:MAG: DoxX family protein [Limnohabitans sp.]|nr:DoxX family protein [Limnohabitans sp.]
MKTIKKWNKWANSHSYFVIDLLRVLTGVFLLYKGLSFMSEPEYYDLFSEELNKFGGGIALVHLVVALNVVGGIMIIVGLLTRWVILVQIPILIGAAIINITGKMEIQNFVLALVMLGVFIFFFFFGSGKNSADYYLNMQV